MEHPFITLFKPAVSAASKKDAIDYLLVHPVLTSPYYKALLENWAATLGGTDRTRAEQAIALKSDLFDQMRAGRLEVAPPTVLLDLASQVVKGTITLEYAKLVASKPETFVELMYPSVTTACEVAANVMLTNWRPAVTLMRVLFASLDGRGRMIPENQRAMELTAVESYLAVVRVACCDVPDGRIFHDVVARAEPLADLDTGSDPPAPILQRLGTLHLDPYVSGRSSDNIDYQLRAWQTRLYEEYGSELAGVPENQLKMPAITEALPKAVLYFRRAAAHRVGEARGRTLKALAQALIWHQFVDLPFDVNECSNAAREALALLPVERFPAEHAELSRFLQQLQKGPSAPSEAVTRAREVLRTPVEKWLTKSGALSTLDVFHQSAAATAETDPRLALELWMAVDGLIRSQPEARRVEHDRSLVKYAIRAFAPQAPRVDESPVLVKAQTLLETADLESWPRPRVIYSLLRLANSTVETNKESDGRIVLDLCSDLASQSAPDPVLSRVLPVLKAMLATGDAVNCVNTGHFGEAAVRYIDAMRSNLDASQPLAGLDIVRRLVDLATPGKPECNEAMDALLVAITENALRLELGADEAATALLQSACRLAMSSFLEGSQGNANAAVFALDVAKGRRFRAALAEPGCALGWLNHPRTLELEKELLALSAKAGRDTGAEARELDKNSLLSGYVGPSEMSGGGNATEQLRNLRIHFDAALEQQLSSVENDPWVPTLDKLQSLLDSETVLVIQYIGENLARLMTLAIFLISDRECFVGQTVFTGTPWGIFKMRGTDGSVTGNMLSLRVSEFRDKIIVPPGPRAADSRALESLEDNYNTYLGGSLASQLKGFRDAGKTHLCISPHGPLHFYPLHLLGPEDHPIVDDWCITYLPHPRLLDREQIKAPSKVELTSIGLNFEAGNQFGLPELIECEDEARAIAGVYG